MRRNLEKATSLKYLERVIKIGRKMYLDDNLYHVYNRGAHKQHIFHSDFQYNFCLNLLEKYKERYRVNIYAYCLMPNHYHLLLRQNEGGSISRFLQTSFNAYVQAFNQMEKHSGTIFQGSAKSTCVSNDEYAHHLIAYVHHNPVAARLVNNMELWKFSDFKEWIGELPFRFEGNDLLKLYFENSKEYRNFMKKYNEEKTQARVEKFLLD